MFLSLRNRINSYLSQMSGRFELDVRYFLKGGAWLSIPFFLNYLLGVVRSVALARLTAQTIYGQFGFVNSVSSSFDLLTLPGVNTALVETVARGNLGSIYIAARARARWGVLSTLGMGVAAIYYLYRGQTNLVVAILVAGAFMPLVSAFQVVQAYYSGKKRFDVVSWINIAYALLNTATILLVLWLQSGLVWLIVANSGSQLLLLFLFYQYTAPKVREAPQDPELVKYGKSLTWAGAISSFAFELDTVILGLSAGFVDVAIYQIASVIPESLKGLMKMLTPMVMPKIAEQPEKRVYTARTRRHLLSLLGINLGVVLFAVLTIPIVISLLYGARYNDSIRFAQLLMLSLIVSLPSYFFIAALQARKQTRAIYHFNLIYGIVQVGTLIAFVPLWGTLGIVWSRILTRLISTLYQWYAVSKI